MLYSFSLDHQLLSTPACFHHHVIAPVMHMPDLLLQEVVLHPTGCPRLEWKKLQMRGAVD